MNPPVFRARRSLLLRLSLVAAVVCAVHLLTLAGDLRLAVSVLLFAMVAGPGFMSLRRRRAAALLVVAALVLAAATLLAWPGGGTQAVLILPPSLGYMATSLFFAHSLLPGEEPVITRMCRFLRRDVLPDGLEAYARGLTWGWAVLPALLACSALAVFAVAGLDAWSWVMNVVSPLILIAFFIGEHFYRGFFLPHLGKASLLQTFDIMFDSASWRR